MSKVIRLHTSYHVNQLFSKLEQKEIDREFLAILAEMVDENIPYNIHELSRFAALWIKNKGSRIVMEELIKMGINCDREIDDIPLWQAAFFKESIGFAPRLADLVIQDILKLSNDYLPVINQYLDEAMQEHEVLLERSYDLLSHYGQEPELQRISLDKDYDKMMENLLDKCNDLRN